MSDVSSNSHCLFQGSLSPWFDLWVFKLTPETVEFFLLICLNKQYISVIVFYSKSALTFGTKAQALLNSIEKKYRSRINFDPSHKQGFPYIYERSIINPFNLNLTVDLVHWINKLRKRLF